MVFDVGKKLLSVNMGLIRKHWWRFKALRQRCCF